MKQYIHVRFRYILLNVYFFTIYFFYNFYIAYLEILRLKVYFENCAKRTRRTKINREYFQGKITMNNTTFR